MRQTVSVVIASIVTAALRVARAKRPGAFIDGAANHRPPGRRSQCKGPVSASPIASSPHRSRRSLAALVAVGIAGAGLAGCTAVPVPPSGTHSGRVSSSPSPTPVALRPAFLNGSDCAGLLSTDEVQKQVVATVAVRRDQDSPPRWAEDVALLQAGGIECVWGGTDMTDTGYDDGVDVTILPNGADQLAAWRTHQPTDYCSELRCMSNSLIQGAWVSVSYSDSERVHDSDAALHGRVSALVALLGSRLTAARAQPWKPAQNAFDPPGLCSQPATTAAIGVGIGVDPATLSLDASSYSVGDDPGGAALGRPGSLSCSWNSGTAGLTVIPGGGWAFPALMTSPPPARVFLGAMREISVAGADQTDVGCGDGCAAFILYRGSFIELTAGTPDNTVTEFTPIVQRIVAALGSIS
jgi:hypothetical protein